MGVQPILLHQNPQIKNRVTPIGRFRSWLFIIVNNKVLPRIGQSGVHLFSLRFNSTPQYFKPGEKCLIRNAGHHTTFGEDELGMKRQTPELRMVSTQHFQDLKRIRIARLPEVNIFQFNKRF